MQNFHFFNGVSLTSTKVPRTGSARSERFGAEKIRANICLPLSKAEAERISLKKVRAILLVKFFFPVHGTQLSRESRLGEIVFG